MGKTSLKPSPFQFFIILFGPLFTPPTLPHHWLVIFKSQFVISMSVVLLCKGREQSFPLTKEGSAPSETRACPGTGAGSFPFTVAPCAAFRAGVFSFWLIYLCKMSNPPQEKVHHTPREICCVPTQPLHQGPWGIL